MGSSNNLKLERRKRRKRKIISYKARRAVQEVQNGVYNDVLEKYSSTSSGPSSVCTSESNGLDNEEPVKLSCGLHRNDFSNTEDEKTLSVVAIDCEMVGVGENKNSALARCSVVNYDGKVIYDTYVKPEDTITDYRTQWSGIRPKDMVNAISFRKARKQAKRLIKHHILVGHSLQSDLHVLKLSHTPTLVRDTSKYVPIRVLAGLAINATPSLKRLTRNLLQTEIQTNEHCSVEDAISSLRLYKLCESQWEGKVKGDGDASYLCDAYWPSWTNMN